MKKKRINRKFYLNKQTISNLNPEEMKNVRGAGLLEWITKQLSCPTSCASDGCEPETDAGY
ncbi:MAG: class I lanthipeptide [Candidatus Thorarchaeota archaeon]